MLFEHLKNTEKFKTVSVFLLHFWFGLKISGYSSVCGDSLSTCKLKHLGEADKV